MPRHPKHPYEPCVPVSAAKVPLGLGWIHEIKHDGYRLIIVRDGEKVRLLTRRGFDWTDRFPRIVVAAQRLRATHVVIDAEAVWCGDDGIADFAQLRAFRNHPEVFAYAFDLLAHAGEDLRRQPLEARKAKLARILAGSTDGIVLSEHMDGDAGVEMFQHACRMGLEGIVSKRLGRRYTAGRCDDWLKIKNPASAAARRIEEAFA